MELLTAFENNLYMRKTQRFRSRSKPSIFAVFGASAARWNQRSDRAVSARDRKCHTTSSRADDRIGGCERYGCLCNHDDYTCTQPDTTATNYYKQSVYDPKQDKIGDVDDVLVDQSGKISGLVVGVGGFLGAGENDVFVPFSAVKSSRKDGKYYLTLDRRKTA